MRVTVPGVGFASVTMLIFSLLSGTFVVTEAQAQSRPKLADVNNRLLRVEKVLDQSLLNMLQQIESLKQEIRGLNGEIESQAFQIENLKKRNRDLYADTDGRISELEEKILILMELQPAEDELLEDDSSSGAGVEDDIDTTASGGGSSVYVPSDESRNTRLDVTQGNAVSLRASADEKAAYATAYDLVVAKKFDLAVRAFEQFLDKYPSGALADNAWYWQGEALYAKRQFPEAISNFKVVTDSFPTSRKVADARLKIAFSHYESGDYDQSRLLLDQIRQDYPGRSAAVLARKRLLEMNEAGL